MIGKTPERNAWESIHNRSLLLDLETTPDGKLLKIGLLFGTDECVLKGRFSPSDAERALSEFSERADFVLGHNILDQGVWLPAASEIRNDDQSTGCHKLVIQQTKQNRTARDLFDGGQPGCRQVPRNRFIGWVEMRIKRGQALKIRRQCRADRKTFLIKPVRGHKAP